MKTKRLWIVAFAAASLAGCGSVEPIDGPGKLSSELRQTKRVAAVAAYRGHSVRKTLNRSAKKAFSRQEIAEILALVRKLPAENYRVVLPVVERDGRVGSEVYGSLPVTAVKSRAGARGLVYSDTGNVQAIFQPCNGGGAGSHTPSQSAGDDVGQRIDTILANIDKSAYVFLTE